MRMLNLPEHWEMMSLEDVASIFDKKRVPLNESQRRQMQGEYPYCGANGVVDYVNDYIFDGEYVLLAEDGGYWDSFENSAYLMKGKFWVNNHAHILQATQGLSNNYFLMCWLNYLDIKPFISGTTRGKLNQGIMKGIPLAIPPLPEQRAIAHVLQTIQEAKAARQREIALERERKAALMDHLFSYGTKDEPRKQTEIGEIPESWEVAKLGEITDIFKGGTPKRSVEKYFQGNIPWAIPTDITALGSDLYINDTNTHISEGALGKSAARLLPAGTVLLTSRATIGETAITTVPMATNQGFANFICRDMLLNVYLAYYLRYVKKKLIDLAHGSTFKEITKGTLLHIEIPLPPLSEQHAIAETLKAFDTKIAALEHEAERLDELFHAMLDELMTGKRSAVPLIDAELPN